MVEWIEIYVLGAATPVLKVSTLVVEWIEINTCGAWATNEESPPSWWSGLKSEGKPKPKTMDWVSTLVVEWIEIARQDRRIQSMKVSTLVVEWIEINVKLI